MQFFIIFFFSFIFVFVFCFLVVIIVQWLFKYLKPIDYQQVFDGNA